MGGVGEMFLWLLLTPNEHVLGCLFVTVGSRCHEEGQHWKPSRASIKLSCKPNVASPTTRNNPSTAALPSSRTSSRRFPKFDEVKNKRSCFFFSTLGQAAGVHILFIFFVFAAGERPAPQRCRSVRQESRGAAIESGTGQRALRGVQEQSQWPSPTTSAFSGGGGGCRLGAGKYFILRVFERRF